MNFLAHFHLAWPDPSLVAGALEGDYFKGPLPGDLPIGLVRGVRLHRAIDAYTDRHPVVEQLRRELPAELRRYSGILIDLCFDHTLSLHWRTFSDLPLREFADNMYRILREHEQELSAPASDMAGRLQGHDILNLYLEWETVTASAERIGERFTRHNPFVGIDRVIAPEKPRIEAAFLNFYPQLQSFCEDWKQHH